MSSFWPWTHILPTAASQATCGLFVSGSEKAVPLRVRALDAQVHCDAGFEDTTEQLAFIADEDVSVTFKFPLPPRAAVYKLEATVGDRVVVTEVKERAAAQAEYHQAVSQGHTAVLAKQESSQVFTLDLGNLEAMQEAVVTVSYLRLLDSVGGALEWVHTATWKPPYLGSAGDWAAGVAVAQEQTPRFAGKVTYSLDYAVTLLSARGIRAVESAAPITCTDLPNEGGLARKQVVLSEKVSDPSKDFTLLVDLAPLLEPSKPASSPAGCSADNGFGTVSIQRKAPSPHTPNAKDKLVALATFVPRALPSADAAAAETTSRAPVSGSISGPFLPVEVVMIIDCSGSMMGPSIEHAREAAVYFIKDLPRNRGIKFNVVVFGDSHLPWSVFGPQDFTAATMADAVAWVQARVHANMGGTEILNTFRSVYGTPVTPGYSRQIILLTDGGVSSHEEQAVFDLVSGASQQLSQGIERLKNRVLNRHNPSSPSPSPSAPPMPAVLCLGIGHGVHRGLLDGLAKRTGGLAQYVTEGGQAIVRKVAFLKKAALCGPSAVHTPRVVCGGALVRLGPHVLPPRLFPDEPVDVLVELQLMPDQAEASIELQGKRGDGSPFAIKLPLQGVPITQGDAYAVLHALCTVNSLMEGSSALHCEPDGTPLPHQPAPEAVKAAVVAAAVEAHLVTPYTAAVGVLLQKNPLNPREVKKVEVPIAVPHGAELWKGALPSFQEHHASLFAPSGGFALNFAPQPVLFGAAPAASFGGGAPAFGAAPAATFGSGGPAFGAGARRGGCGFGGGGPAPGATTWCAAGTMPNTAPSAAAYSFGAAPAPPPAPAVCGYSMAPAPGPAGCANFGAAVPNSSLYQGGGGLAARTFGGAPGGPPPAQPFDGAALSSRGAAAPAGCFQMAPAPAAFSAASAPAFGAAPVASAATTFGTEPSSAPAVGTFGAAPLSAPAVGTFGAAHSSALAVGTAAAASAAAAADAAAAAPVDAMDEDYEMVDATTAEEETVKETAKETASGQQVAQPPARSTAEVLSRLNLARNVDGFWAETDELVSDLTSQVVGDRAAAAARAGKPSELTGDQWVTVLALAFLRKHCAAEKGAWEGMESKALAWLASGWPAGVRPVGFTVLAAAKWV